jgi:cysteine-rich repeat protein
MSLSHLLAVCGDGIIIPLLEECDQGRIPATDGDGCSADCLVEEHWNCTDPLAGQSNCTRMQIRFAVGFFLFSGSLFVAICGDRFIVAPEQCDTGNVGPGCTNCQRDLGWDCPFNGTQSECFRMPSVPLLMRDFFLLFFLHI